MKKLADFIYKFTVKMGNDRVRAHSAEAAFFVMMSVFPVMMLLLTLLQFTPISQTDVVIAVERITPFQISSLLKPIISSIYRQSTALLSWSAIVAVWVAGKGIMGLTDGLNSIHGVVETRNYFVIRFRAACYTVVLVLALLVSLVTLVFGYTLQRYLRRWFPILEKYPDALMIVPIVIAMLLLIVLFLAMYMFLPNQKKPFRSQFPGAVFTAVSWAVFSYAFSIYLDHVGNMSVLYGSLTTLVVVMLWLYSSMYLLFVGAELNHYIEDPKAFDL